MSDILIGVGLTVVISAVSGLLLSLIKKGNFEKWGSIAGKSVSYFARMKLGKGKWEKLEDAMAIAVISFAKGFKKGLDIDDSMSDEELIAQHEQKRSQK